jgi:uncharacterized protein YegP (UPF0339 family)
VAHFQCFRTQRGQVRWRLLSGNNRVLGLSERAADDHRSALAEVEVVRESAARRDFHIDRIGSGLWSWRMVFPGDGPDSPPVAVAVSARTFARQVDARLSAERFRLSARDAEPDRILAVFRPGRRGRVLPLADDPRPGPPER